MTIPDRQPPAYISVDVETAGAAPTRHALLSVGACLVDDPGRSFYVELQPTTPEADPAASARTTTVSPSRTSA